MELNTARPFQVTSPLSMHLWAPKNHSSFFFFFIFFFFFFFQTGSPHFSSPVAVATFDFTSQLWRRRRRGFLFKATPRTTHNTVLFFDQYRWQLVSVKFANRSNRGELVLCVSRSLGSGKIDNCVPRRQSSNWPHLLLTPQTPNVSRSKFTRSR